MRSAVVVVLMMWVAWGGVFASEAEAVVLINELLADPAVGVGDANRDGEASPTQDEFLELVNLSLAPISLAGWQVSDETGLRHLFAPDTLIPARGFFVLFGGGMPQGFADAALASTGRLALNNTGDTVSVSDALGAAVDVLTYGPDGGHDVSLTRAPDGTGAFVLHDGVSGSPFSPGTTVGGELLLALETQPVSEPVIEDLSEGIDPPAGGNQPSVPEPSSLGLLGAGLLLGAARRLRGVGR